MNKALQRSPNSTLLASVNWARVSRIAGHELHNREVHAPAVSAFRWWARRPHSVMGALLDAAVSRYGPSMTVSDPFSGGGTVAFEAVRRGLKTYAQDLYPWPTYGLSTTMRAIDLPAFDEASKLMLERLDGLRRLYIRKDGRELSHLIRVRFTHCQSCSHRHFLFPAPLVSVCSRSKGNRKAYFGCRTCGTVSLRNSDIRQFRCDGCGRRQSATSSTPDCPHCCKAPAKTWDGPHNGGWTVVLVQEVTSTDGRYEGFIRKPLPGDPVSDIAPVKIPRALLAPIPQGMETRRLLAAGFRTWSDLYTRRQIAVLTGALSAIKELPTDTATRDRLALAIIGAAEMPAYISRWDRFHLKQFEGLANHRFSRCGVAVESNVLAPIGRGILRLRLKSARKAAQWARDAMGHTPEVRTIEGTPPRTLPQAWDALIATGSSQTQALADKSVHVVLTDPPYHDDVQYGELAQLFHQWLAVHRPVGQIDLTKEAVANTMRGSGNATFESIISECLEESLRTLRPDGVLVLTFHNRRIAAWRALAAALWRAGFRVNAIATVRSENGDDHCKRHVDAMLEDIVLECRRRSGVTAAPKVTHVPRTAAQKNLIAMGLALALVVMNGQLTSLADKYTTNLAKLKGRSRLIV